MTDLLVLAFADEADAIKMRDALFELKAQQLIRLTDAVSVTRKPTGKMTVKHEVKLVDSAANQGLLLDFVFWMFYQEMAASAATKTPDELQSYMGMDEKLVKEISKVMESCHGALFLLADKLHENSIEEKLQDFEATLLKRPLSKEDEVVMMAVFGR
jgi:uncharacterized membrane protein